MELILGVFLVLTAVFGVVTLLTGKPKKCCCCGQEATKVLRKGKYKRYLCDKCYAFTLASTEKYRKWRLIG